jgi:hypothetical protein
MFYALQAIEWEARVRTRSVYGIVEISIILYNETGYSTRQPVKMMRDELRLSDTSCRTTSIMSKSAAVFSLPINWSLPGRISSMCMDDESCLKGA